MADNAYTGAKREVLFLDAARWLTDEICNYAVFTPKKDGDGQRVWFDSEIHKRVFCIMLADFLSPTDPNAVGERTPYLKALGEVCNSPRFSINDSVRHLKSAVDSFRDWLDTETQTEFWLPTIEVQETIKLTRAEILKAAGNIVKHNPTRLWGVARKFDRLLRAKGHDYLKGRLLLDLHEGFYFKLYEDVFAYHASTVAEFVTGIRWGIHEYLLPEYGRSYTKLPDSYSFDVPSDLNDDEYIRGLYWRLMNSVRSKPIMEKLRAPEYYKWRH